MKGNGGVEKPPHKETGTRGDRKKGRKEGQEGRRNWKDGGMLIGDGEGKRVVGILLVFYFAQFLTEAQPV